MKRILIASPVMALSILACLFGSNAAPQAGNVSTENAPTPSSGISVSFKNVSFVIPEGTATGADAEVAPALTENESPPWNVAPEHMVFSLRGWPKENTTNTIPSIMVFPAQEYAAVNSWAEGSLTRLQAILANPETPITNENASTVPFYGSAAQQYAAQAKLLSFNGGNGVRMVSQYGQYPGPITKDNSFYHFEGLTGDGKYLVAVLLPLTLPLQSTAENPSADGIQYFDPGSADETTVTAYYQAITDKLNAAGPDAFQPSLNQLDALIQSITVTSQ